MDGVKTIVGVYDTLVSALAALAGAMVVADAVLIVVDVSIRAAGVPPPAYTIAIVEYSLLYITMFAAPGLVRSRGHVTIDALVSRFPARVEWLVAKLTYLLAICISLVIVYFSYDLLADSYRAGYFDERGIDVPQWLLYVSIPIGFGLVAVEFVRIFHARELMHRRQSEAEGV